MPEKNYTGLEERTAKVEGILEQMDKRLDRVEVGIMDLKNEIKSDMAKLELRIDKLETKVDNQFKWLVGIVVGMWITTISSVLSMFFYIIFKG